MPCLPRTVIVAALLAAHGSFSGVKAASAAEIRAGSGVVIGAQGEVLTNAHVVANCEQITVRSSPGDSAAASLIASDEKNDLAVIRRQSPLSSVATFRDGPIRAGDEVVALG